MIRVHQVSLTYKRGINALSNVSLQVEKGEFVFLVESSGAGKTTLLRLLYRELTPTAGQIVVAGKNLAKISRTQLPLLRRKMGLVFQDVKLLPNRNVGENIAVAMKIMGARWGLIRQKVSQLLHQMSISHRKDAYPAEISGGEQQRVAIARAVANVSVLILADEPTGNLEPKLSFDVMHLFERFNFRGTTVLVATHDSTLVQQCG